MQNRAVTLQKQAAALFLCLFSITACFSFSGLAAMLMVLSNTCSPEKDMSEDTYLHLMKMIHSQQKSKKLLSVIPFAMYKKLIKWAVMKKKTKGFSQEEKLLMENLCDAMLQLLTKPYEYHMIDFLVDAQNHFGMTTEDFKIWDDKVLQSDSQGAAAYHKVLPLLF